MRTIGTAFTELATKAERRTAVRVLVNDQAGVEWDLSDWQGYDWIRAVEWSETIDEPVGRAKIVLAREMDRFLTLVPGKTNRANQNHLSTAADVLQEKRRVVIEVGVAPVASVPSTWIEVFRGRIDKLEWGGDDIVLTCRDLASDEMDTFIQGTGTPQVEREYGSAAGVAVETVMQSIMTDEMPAAGKFAVKTLYTPTSPSFLMRVFDATRTPLLSFLQTLADLFGWYLHYRWDDSAGSFKLTLWTPDRGAILTSAVDRDFDLYDVNTMERSAEDIRNRVELTWSDSNGQRTQTIRQDALSQAVYGVRFMGLGEASNSQVDTLAEVQDLGDIALDDLAWPTMRATVSVPCDPWVQLGDVVRFPGDTRWWDADDSRGWTVLSLSHSVGSDVATTRIVCKERELGVGTTGSAAGGGNGTAGSRGGRWLGREAKPGIAPWVSWEKNPAAISCWAFNNEKASPLGQSIPTTTITKVELDDELYDNSDDFDDSVGYDFTAPRPGIYSIDATVALDAMNASKTLTGYIYRKGVSMVSESMTTSAGTNFVKISAMVFLGANDTISMYVHHDDDTRKVDPGSGDDETHMTVQRFK